MQKNFDIQYHIINEMNNIFEMKTDVFDVFGLILSSLEKN